MAFSLDEIRGFASNPRGIPAPGSYGEGQITNITEMLKTMKEAVKAGKMSVTEYSGIAEPLVDHARNFAAGAGGNGAILGQWNNLYQSGFASPQTGKVVIPFSPQEYNALPDSVLPTSNDIQSGNINRSLLPTDRIQGGDPNPTDKGGLEGGTSVGGMDETKLRNEAQLGFDKREGLRNEQAMSRRQMLNDLTSLIEQSNARQFEENAPGILESLNSSGVLRSTGTGEAFAKEKGRLASVGGEQIALQALQDRETDLGTQSGNLNTYLGGRESAIGRRFSLEDFDRQVKAGKELGGAVQPVAQPSGGKGTGALSGAATGAAAGAKLGPWGGAIGAVTGGVAGGIAGKGK